MSQVLGLARDLWKTAKDKSQDSPTQEKRELILLNTQLLLIVS